MRKLKGNENAVIVGTSWSGTPSLPNYNIEIGEVFTYADGDNQYENDQNTGIIDRSFKITSGVYRGWIGIKNSIVPNNTKLEIRDEGDNAEFFLSDETDGKELKKEVKDKNDILNKGFDLENIDNNDGEILPKSIAEDLWTFLQS